MKNILRTLVLFFLINNDIISQNNSISSSIVDYEPVEVSNEYSNELNNFIGDHIIKSKFFEISGKTGEIKLCYSNFKERIIFESITDDINFRVTKVYNDTYSNKSNLKIEFMGVYGVADVKMKFNIEDESKYSIIITNIINNKILFEYTGYTISSNLEKNYISDNIDFSYKIREFIIAEDNRNFDEIYSFYSPRIKKYWTIKYPTYSELKKLYESTWKNTSYSKNFIQRIEKINNNTYDLYTKFEFFRIKKNKLSIVDSQLRFILNDQGKIIELFKKK